MPWEYSLQCLFTPLIYKHRAAFPLWVIDDAHMTSAYHENPSRYCRDRLCLIMPGREVSLQQRKIRGRARVRPALGLMHECCLICSGPRGGRRCLACKLVCMRRPQHGAPVGSTQLLSAP